MLSSENACHGMIDARMRPSGRVPVWIALTMSLMTLGSNGFTMIMRGSGTVIEASDLSGVGAP